MMKIVKNVLFTLMLVLPLNMTVASPQQDIVERLAGYLNSANTMQAEFDQKTLDRQGLRVLQRNEGKMVFKKPDLFRWSVESPIQQLIVTNGKKLWIYDIDLEQVSVSNVKKGEHDKPAMILMSNPDELQKQFTIRPFKDKQPGEWFELIPKQKQDAQFLMMGLYFENGVLKQLQFEDAAGQLSNIDFKNVKKNLKVNDKTFDFTPPKGVDVVGMN